MQRTRALLFAVLLLVPCATPVLAAPTAKASIGGVTVSPSQPAPGEQVTLTVTIRNGESTTNSPSNSFEVNQITLRTSDGRLLKTVRDVGTLPEGTTVDVPLTVTFDSPGTKSLDVTVYGDNGDRNVALRHPVSVPVRDPATLVSVSAPTDPVVGVENETTVTVANGEESAISGLRVRLSGRGVDVANPTRVSSSLDAGASETLTFDVTPTATDASLEATLTYRTEAGNSRRTNDSVSFTADPLRDDVRLDATVPPGGTNPPVSVDVSNLGNAAIEDVTVTASVPNGTVVAQRPLERVEAGETRTLRLNVTDVGETTLSVDATYDVGLGRGEATTRVAYRPNPGRIELTGVDFEREDDRIHISGSASNVGLSETNGVVVSVVASEGVTPAPPYREYFVGTVPASDFVSFDLYARVDSGVETVPVRVTYLVDGERTTTVTEVPIADLPPATDDTQQRRPSTLILGAGVVAGLVIVAGAVYAFRRR
ncbi:MAG: hypothetical protein ABEJ82_08690 [Haloplanus sp.]